MKIFVSSINESNTLVIPYWINDETIANVLPEGIFSKIKPDMGFLSKPFQKKRYFINNHDIMIVSLGKKEDISPELIRKFTSFAYTIIKNELFSLATDIFLYSSSWKIDKEAVLKSSLEGLLLTSYRYKPFKNSEKEKKFYPEKINLVTQKRIKNYSEIIRKTQILADSIFLARDITNGPANVVNIDYIEKLSRKIARKNNLKIKIFNNAMLKKMGLNLLLAVGKGGNQKPRLIEMEYKSGKKNPVICLIGKGIVFDTGGLNLKPSNSMDDMKSDMAGVASVLGIIEATSKLRIPVNITALLPLAENAVDGNSYRPGDIIFSYNKKSVEIKNTDAEGRLILADTLAYSESKKSNMVIDIATLTGAAIIALGMKITAGFFRNTDIRDKMILSSNKTGEPIWELPLFDGYKAMLKNDIADLSNIGAPPREAGSIVASLFLSEFVKNENWVHLDIAGPSFIEKDDFYNIKGATGVMIRTIIDFLENYVENDNIK